MRNTLHIALIGMACLMSAPAALGNSAPPDDVLISQQADVASVEQYAFVGESFTLQAAGCCDQGYDIKSVNQAPGCCDQGYDVRSQLVSSRTLVLIAAMAMLLLAAVSLQRLSFNKHIRWTSPA